MEQIVCQTHQTEHSSDNLAVASEFITKVPEIILPSRKAYKKSRWDILYTEFKNKLPHIEKIDLSTNPKKYIIELINIVLEGIEISVPLAKSSPYNKRW